jgi:hypothetical protein
VEPLYDQRKDAPTTRICQRDCVRSIGGRAAAGGDRAADEIAVWRLRAYAAAKRHGELEHAYRGYLSAAWLDALSDAGRQNLVVRLYQTLGRARVMNGRATISVRIGIYTEAAGEAVGYTWWYALELSVLSCCVRRERIAEIKFSFGYKDIVI